VYKGLNDPSVLPTLHHLRYVPSYRRSMDVQVPCRSRALDFMNGLFAVSSVVLNGRTPGDMDREFTCCANPLSVCVSVSVPEMYNNKSGGSLPLAASRLRLDAQQQASNGQPAWHGSLSAVSRCVRGLRPPAVACVCSAATWAACKAKQAVCCACLCEVMVAVVMAVASGPCATQSARCLCVVLECELI